MLNSIPQINSRPAWAASGAAESWPESLRGACSAPLHQLNPDTREELLRQAGSEAGIRPSEEKES